MTDFPPGLEACPDDAHCRAKADNGRKFTEEETPHSPDCGTRRALPRRRRSTRPQATRGTQLDMTARTASSALVATSTRARTCELKPSPELSATRGQEAQRVVVLAPHNNSSGPPTPADHLLRQAAPDQLLVDALALRGRACPTPSSGRRGRGRGSSRSRSSRACRGSRAGSAPRMDSSQAPGARPSRCAPAAPSRTRQPRGPASPPSDSDFKPRSYADNAACDVPAFAASSTCVRSRCRRAISSRYVRSISRRCTRSCLFGPAIGEAPHLPVASRSSRVLPRQEEP